MKKAIRIISGALLLLSVTFRSAAQSLPEKVSLDWQTPCVEEVTEQISLSYLYFTGAHLQRVGNQLLPTWHYQLPCPNAQQLQVSLSGAVWVRIPEEELAYLPTACVDTVSSLLRVSRVTTRHHDFAELTIVPFRKVQGHYEKLTGFSLSGQWVPSLQKRISRKSYVTHSVLSDGEIYKVALTRTGVHKLTYGDLKQMGVSMDRLAIGKIALYGNGGGLMPENTAIPVYDDPEEIPVKVVDVNGNGLFDEEDCLLFYGQGIVSWEVSDNLFKHHLNYFSDRAYYFVKINDNPRKSLTVAAAAGGSATHVQTAYDYRTVIEEDLISPTNLGRIWLQDQFDAVTSRTYRFTLPAVESGVPVRMLLRLAVSSPSSPSYFSFKGNGGSLTTLNFSSTVGSFKSVTYSFEPTAASISLDVSYSKPLNSSKGWLDYIELQTVAPLKQLAAQMDFRTLSTVGDGNITEYRIDAQGHSLTVWEVTDPCNYREVRYTSDNGMALFRMTSDSLREFVSFYGTDMYAVTPIGRVQHQDLHALETADWVIVTAPDFLSVANEWAAFRLQNDGLKGIVVTTEQIYNEFGSGMQDISAIRNFLRMLYLKFGEQAPKNVMLLGKVSFDFRNRHSVGTNYIPNYQGENIFNEDGCLSTDDFFVKLDDYEGQGNLGSMDMGIGRVPVSSLTQARTVLQKVKRYSSRTPLEVSGGEVSNMAEWRNIIAFCADDDADQNHLFNSDRIAQMVASRYPLYNIDKIYLDAYKKVSTSQGQRYPDANSAINQRVNKGCLLFTYMGHGGDNGWAHERVLRRADIYSWSNRNALPLFYAGSCGFGEYDKLSAVSPSEDMLFKSDGGAIAVISATRSSYGGTNESFGLSLHRLALAVDSSDAHLTMGEVFARSKNSCGSVQMYVFFGDPSMMLAFPQMKVLTDSVNGNGYMLGKDTLRALSYVTVSGHVARGDGSVATDFNGYVCPNVFDKSTTVTTLLNNSVSTEKSFQIQKNSLFKGKINVTNGYFRFGFLLPKDLNYEYGIGKISYYAYGSQSDACGFDSVVVGGLSDTLIHDEKGPDINLYMNDPSFANGGITSDSPTLMAEIKDESGVNAAGTGIGHDIVAVLDGNEAERILLNDYYECDENSSTSGKVGYRLTGLETGTHTLTLRAWDVLNNRGEASLSFVVTGNEAIKLTHVLNYPNPFTTRTGFYFEHNQLHTDMSIRIRIFTVSGKLVKTITETVYGVQSYRCGPFEWDGRDDFGGKLAKGTYIYELSVRTSDNKTASKTDRIVIL